MGIGHSLCGALQPGIPFPYLQSGQELLMKDKRLAFFDKDCIPLGRGIPACIFTAACFPRTATRPWQLVIRPSSPRLDTDHNKQVFTFLRKNR